MYDCECLCIRCECQPCQCSLLTTKAEDKLFEQLLADMQYLTEGPGTMDSNDINFIRTYVKKLKDGY